MKNSPYVIERKNAFSILSVICMCLCIILYIAVLLIYTFTVFGIIPTKKLLYPLFSLPLLYHIFVEDMKLYILAEPSVPFLEWLPEISVLLIMLGLLFISISFKKTPSYDGVSNCRQS